MRFAGIIFLAVGVLLCTTITWAGIGFIAMSLGLISLRIAEDRKKAAAKPSTPAAIEQKPVSPRPSGKDAVARESDTWSSLVENDEDISRIVKTLTPFGQEYVDQFSRAYLVFNDKACLPVILDMIIASARKSADRVIAGSPSGAAGLTATATDRMSDSPAVPAVRIASAPDKEGSDFEGGSEHRRKIDQDPIKAKDPMKASLLVADPDPVDPPKAVRELDELKLLLGRITSTANEVQ